MTRYVHYATNNNCYKAAKKATKTVGILVHSTGVNNNTLKRYVDYEEVCGRNIYGNHWNVAKPDGQNICVHAFIGKDKNGNVAVVEILPLDYICWGCGSGAKGSYNFNPYAHIQFEICEGSVTDKTYFDKVYKCAVEYCAWLCKHFNLTPNDITSHKEANAKGYASAHSDPFDYFAKFGKTMDMFRKAVQAELTGNSNTNSTTTPKSIASRYIYKSYGTCAIRKTMTKCDNIAARCERGKYYCISAVITDASGNVWLQHADTGYYSCLKDTDGSLLFEKTTMTYTVYHSAATLNIRNSPNGALSGATYKVNNAVYTVNGTIETKGGYEWIKVVYQGNLKYVAKNYLK